MRTLEKVLIANRGEVAVSGTPTASAPPSACSALQEFEVEGVATLLPFHRAFLATEQWQRPDRPRLLGDRARSY